MDLETNLKKMNDKTLMAKTETLVREERELLTTVLKHLDEINRRRLYSAMGFKSLFDFATRHLKYSEDQAYRRISAMKLLNELPEIEAKMNSGEVTLTHLGLAQTLFRQEKKTQQKEMPRQMKVAVLQKMENTTTRDAERIALSLSSTPEIFRPDRVQPISDSKVELKFTAANETLQKIQMLKGLLAHQYPNLSIGELFEMLCQLGLEQWSISKSAAPRKRRVTERLSKAQIRREVFQRANHRCEKCGSSHALEVDHRRPRGLGGSSDLENLRLLCRSCNQRAAIQSYGLDKMNQYLSQKSSL